MVSPLKYRSSDPNKKGRGAGEYYKRSGYKKGWESKYSEEADEKRQSSKVARYGKSTYKHAGDHNTYSKGNKIIKKGKKI